MSNLKRNVADSENKITHVQCDGLVSLISDLLLIQIHGVSTFFPGYFMEKNFSFVFATSWNAIN